MDRLPFISSESEESDSTAQQRWESEGGNPGQLRQLPSNKKEEIATDAAHSDSVSRFYVRRTICPLFWKSKRFAKSIFRHA
jgi:hypothetical protein